MNPVRIAFIGAGGLANAMHYPSYRDMDDAEIVCLCDLNEERLHATGDKFGISKRYTDYRRMLDENEVDGVYVIMPPHHLFDVAMDVIERGLNIFVEKPPGVTRVQTEMLARACEEHGVKSMVGFNRRFIPVLCEAKKIVEQRGPIIQCVSTFYKHHLRGKPYYRGAVDILTCDAVHAVDTLRWLGEGDAELLASTVDRFYMDFDNAFNALVRFHRHGDGPDCIGVLLTNWAVGGRVHVFELHAQGISAFVDGNSKVRILADNQPEPDVLDTFEVAGSEEPYRYYGFFDENRHFVECIRENREPVTCFADAAHTMALVEAIYAMADL